MINVTAAWNKILKKPTTTFFLGCWGVMVSNILGGTKEQLVVYICVFVVSVAAEYYCSPIVHFKKSCPLSSITDIALIYI